MADPLAVADGLDRIARRISDALYYDKLGPIGVKGSVSPGLRHDDYDLLRVIARDMRRTEYLRLAEANKQPQAATSKALEPPA